MINLAAFIPRAVVQGIPLLFGSTGEIPVSYTHLDHSVFFRDEAGSGGSVESDGVVMFCGREAGRNAGRGMMKRTKIRLYGCGNAI